MDGDRANALPRLVGIGEIESLRKHHKIDLYGCRLPLAPEGVAHDDVDLRRIEGTVARIKAPLCARVAQRLLDHRLRLLPELRIAERLGRLRREDKLYWEVEPGVDLPHLF